MDARIVGHPPRTSPQSPQHHERCRRRADFARLMRRPHHSSFLLSNVRPTAAPWGTVYIRLHGVFKYLFVVPIDNGRFPPSLKIMTGDDQMVLGYLQKYPLAFVSPMEVCKRAGGKSDPFRESLPPSLQKIPRETGWLIASARSKRNSLRAPGSAALMSVTSVRASARAAPAITTTSSRGSTDVSTAIRANLRLERPYPGLRAGVDADLRRGWLRRRSPDRGPRAATRPQERFRNPSIESGALSHSIAS